MCSCPPFSAALMGADMRISLVLIVLAVLAAGYGYFVGYDGLFDQEAEMADTAALEPQEAEAAPVAAMDTPPEETLSEDDRLNIFFAESFEAELMRSPIYLTFLGRPERLGEWDDFTDAAADEVARITLQELDRLHGEFDFDALSPAMQVSYLNFEHRNESRLEADLFRHQGYVDNQMNSITGLAILILTQIHPVSSLETAEAYVSRLVGMETALDQAAQVIRERTDFGTVLPAFAYPLMLEQIAGITSGAPFDNGEESILLSSFRSRLAETDLDEETQTRLIDEASAALEGPVARGFASMAAAHEEAAAQATGDYGVWNLPDGEAFYEERIRNYTHSSMTADDLHQFGLSEVARVHDEMRGIMVELGFEGTLQEFFEHLETDPANFYPNTDEGRQQFLDDAISQTARVTAAAPDYFGRLPQAEMVVQRIEPYREDTAAMASYNSPSPDGTRPGIFWANLRDMAGWPKHGMATTVFHEGSPGHHFHSAIQQELEGIPAFQQFGGTTAFNEGWALYSERVAREMGAHADLYSEFGQLVAEIFRDARLVVDTGIHSQQWTRTQAFDYMMEATGMPEIEVRTEIDRYFVLPGQALAYRMGMEKILQLREHAQTSLGDDFDIRAFHDVVLGNGAVPMPVLDVLVQNYIDETLANSPAE